MHFEFESIIILFFLRWVLKMPESSLTVCITSCCKLSVCLFFTHHSRKHWPVVEKAAVLHQLLLFFCNCLATAKSFLLHPPPPSIIWHSVECTLVWWASPCFRYQRALPQASRLLSSVWIYFRSCSWLKKKWWTSRAHLWACFWELGQWWKANGSKSTCRLLPPPLPSPPLIADGDETVWSAMWLLWAPPTVTSAPVVK